VSLLTASRENFAARDLHPTHWGKLCTSETPEGPAVGLRKNLAVTCEISTESDVDEDVLLKEFVKIGLKRIE
ncbi:MAG: DNA-directed RNA polymerase subunit B'', partial [Candidatus Aenigmarchaeota archaeon]|nr:DNA-directed RNA polymerase subunit B'' [Candidatus Aenigmarchaeota archaeon]